MDLEYNILSNQKIQEIVEKNFEITERNIEKVTKDKVQEYEDINQRIVSIIITYFKIQKDLEKKTAEEPIFKIEQEKNVEYKKKLEFSETALLSLNSQVEILEMANESLVKKKEDVISNRKKLINQNDELRREIESKNQLNEIRIQKKVKDNNSEEIQKLEIHLQSIKDTIAEVNVSYLTEHQDKINKEIDKTKLFSLEIIKLNLDLNIKNKTRQR